MYNKEMACMFLDTLQPPLFEMMVGSMSSSFADLVTNKERIEEGLKDGKIPGVPGASSDVRKFSRSF